MKIDKEKIERRVMKVECTEQRSADGETPKMTIGGYAVRYDEPQTYTYGEDSYTEVIRRGALDGADMSRVPLRYNHNDSVLVMARTKNDSLRLTIDEHGLYIEADLIDTQNNRDLYKCIKEGLLDEMSFAFTVAKGGDEWKAADDGKSVSREIKQIDCLYDVSVVDNGFYETTSVSARDFFSGRVDAQRAADAAKLAVERARALALAKA